MNEAEKETVIADGLGNYYVVVLLCGETHVLNRLQHLIHQRHLPDILAWLKGYSLPESTYAKLQIRPPDDNDAPEGLFFEMVLELCRCVCNPPCWKPRNADI